MYYEGEAKALSAEMKDAGNRRRLSTTCNVYVFLITSLFFLFTWREGGGGCLFVQGIRAVK